MKPGYFYLFSIVILFSCTKDKTPVKEGPKKTIFENITGQYKVYDTNCVFLYEMDLTYNRANESLQWDSLVFYNFDNDFYYSKSQNTTNFEDYVPSKLISLSSPFPTKDKNNKSWSLFNSSSGGIYDNTWRNDTIRMCFRKHNTPWWPSESVPYLDTIIKQIAVKQH
ncbi:MAG: hypothetical protein ACK476_08615 [Fluviicola sp.]